MSNFCRIELTNEKLKELEGFLKSNDFIQCLKKDKKNLFLAFRPDCATIYRFGRALCYIEKSKNDGRFELKLNASFLPYIKTMCAKGKKEVHMTQLDCQKIIKEYNFEKLYDEIESMVEYKSDPEALYVSELYKYKLSKDNKNIFLLDIEAAFEGNKNRIDVVLYNNLKRQLCFVEVKRFEDDRLKDINNDNKEKDKDVIKQLETYKDLICKKRKEIIESYNKVIDYYKIMKNVADVNYIDENKDIKLALLVTEFNSSDNKSSDFKDIQNKIHNMNLGFLSIGNTKSAQDVTLDKWWKEIEKSKWGC